MLYSFRKTAGTEARAALDILWHNLLVGTDPAKIVASARETLAGNGKAGRIPPMWDGHAAHRIVEVLLKVVPRGNAS